jgi:hypothetical protein
MLPVRREGGKMNDPDLIFTVCFFPSSIELTSRKNKSTSFGANAVQAYVNFLHLV